MTSANTPIPIAIISPVRTKDHSPVKATSRQTMMRIAARAGRLPGVDVDGICLFVPNSQSVRAACFNDASGSSQILAGFMMPGHLRQSAV
jgi:hypothetical protein